MNRSSKDFLGIGWAFPTCLKGGKVDLAEFEDDVRQAVRIILGTSPGERVMRPDFGAGLKDFVFEPINMGTMQRIKTRVEEALIDWEPRIRVEEVKVTSDPAAPGVLFISVEYRIRITNSLQNLVYPFYLEEGSSR